MNKTLLFNVSAIIEVLIGFALLVAPLLVIQLLFGQEISATGVSVARILGVALVSIGVAGWEPKEHDVRLAPRAGLCIYNVGAAIVLAIFGLQSISSGILLWPTVFLHGLIGAMMLRVLISNK